MKITDAYWTVVENELALRIKTNGEWFTVRPPFKPYFFVEEKHAKYFDNVETGDFVTLEGEKCVKVNVNFPNEVPLLASKYNIPTYESDIPFVLRCCIDRNISWSEKPAILYFDIEVSSEKGFPRPEHPEQRILSIACIDEKNNEYFICDDSEMEIFSQFKKLVRHYDLLVGFYSSIFDEPYMKARAQTLGFKLPHIQSMDFAELYGKLRQKERTPSLETIAEEEIGKEIKKPVARGKMIDEWFKKDREALKEYNLNDVRILKEIDEALKLVKIFVEIANYSGVPYSLVQYPSKVVDALILREAQKRNPRIVFPRNRENGMGEKYEGALVMQPKPGLHENLIEIDFQSMYPSIIRTFNIGVDTINGEIKTEKLSFKKEPRSLFASVLDELVALREQHKKLAKAGDEKSKIKEQALKLISNVFYGVIGCRFSRYYNKDVAESITLTGKALITLASRFVKEYGAEVIYGDTDSILYKGNVPLDELNNRIREEVLKKYHVPQNYYTLKIETKYIYEWCWIGKEKKRRVGDIIYPEKKRMVLGYEVVRRNVPEIVAMVQEKMFDLLRENEKVRREYAEKVRKELLEGKYDEKLIITSGTKENHEEYKNINCPQAKALRQAIELGVARPGEQIRYVYTDVNENGLEVKVVIPGEPLPKITRRAREYYWDNLVLPRIEPFLFEKHQTILEEWL